MGNEEDKRRTIEVRIEQAAHDIIVACLTIEELTIGKAKGSPEHRMKLAARSAQFHAEGILKGGKDEL